jgi:predicted PurR-regulated permease PerM
MSDPHGSMPYTSPPWQPNTRLAVGLLMLLIGLVGLYMLRTLVVPLMLALLLAYFLDPIVDWLSKRLRLPRGPSTALVFLVLILFFIGIMTGLGLAFSNRVGEMASYLLEISNRLPEDIETFSMTIYQIGPYEVDLTQVNLGPLASDLAGIINPFISQAGAVMGSVAAAAASTVGFLVLVLVIGFYLLVSFDGLKPSLISLVPYSARDDFDRLLGETSRIWNAFLRGQSLLALVMTVIVSAAMSILGVNFPLVLGLIAGIAEFIPWFGPFIAGLAAVVVAFFQPSNVWGLSSLALALVVLVVFIIIQQIEATVLQPKIIGVSLDLHPLIVFMAIIGGGILFGFIGIILSAPSVASVRLWGGYLYRKVVGLDTPPPVVLEPLQESQRTIAMRRTISQWLSRVDARRKRRSPAGKDTGQVPQSGEDPME